MAVAAAGLVSSFVATVPAASAAPADNGGYTPADPAVAAHGSAPVGDSAKLADGLDRKPAGTYKVFVQFAGSGAAAAGASVAPKGKAAEKKAVKDKRAAIDRTANAVVGTATAQDAKTKKANRSAKAVTKRLYATTNTVPGVAISADLASIKAVAARSDVVKISQIVPKTLNNAGAAQFTKVLNAWQDTGLLGNGVRVGIIDTGIDYTHADFGGPGTVAAWDAAHADSAGAWTPTAKVVGGYDFSGDDYNADPTAADYQPVPHPDSNPLDCYGHGTHVAGTVAGSGVSADGSTFTGDYSKLTGDDLYAMKVGPGMAPKASLYALKVFGCTGSTDLVGQALDWALDPNGDGDFSDKLDIVNLSLGSDYGTEDDPENAIIDVLAQYGVLPVIAMGNANDVTDAGGTPGNAVRSLAVAAVVDPYQVLDGIRVDAPADAAGIAAGQVSVAYDWAGKAPVSGDVVAIGGANADGCSPLSAEDAAKVAGKVAWLEWDDNDATRRCGSAARATNIDNAGGLGSIFTSQLNAFNAGITGSAKTPVFQITADETTKLRPAVDAGTLKVTFDGSLVGTIQTVTPALGDTISSFSSRGTHGTQNPVKPDVAAPGSSISSAGIGSGNKSALNSGTSMATPHIAGISALLKQEHPTWSTEQLKAAIMNTANHDVFTELGQTGDRYGPARVGSGRVDALQAVTTDVLAYNTDTPGGVSATFGVVWQAANKAKSTQTRTIKVQNTAKTGATFKVSYEGLVTSPGIQYTVKPASIYLPPKGSANVTVTMTVTTAKLDHTIDPTMDSTTPNPYTGLDEPRQYETDASGRVLLKATGKPTLRVPVFGVAKPYSTTKPTLVGKGKNTSIGLKGGKGVAGGYTSLVSVLQAGVSSSKLPKCTKWITNGCASTPSDKAADIQYVGAGSAKGDSGTYADGFLWFGVSTYGDWATIGHSVVPYVDFDVNGDGDADYEVYAQSIEDGTGEPTDLISAFLVDLNADELISISPVNFNYGDTDTNVFDGNAILLPVDPAAIGVTAATKSLPISYTVGTYSTFTGEDVDTVTGSTYNVTKPQLTVEAPLYIDAAKSAVPYQATGKNVSALVLQLNGKPKHRATVLRIQ
ncbi:S8 family peptidase [Nakamurella lactea]|uniref:S8 family peptidase n=1 Tax=Nakamurella lactea TaxID=459515 RepID=UPI00042251E8|nr:S8 family serine peptidase [Nakamurella lactea]